MLAIIDHMTLSCVRSFEHGRQRGIERAVVWGRRAGHADELPARATGQTSLRQDPKDQLELAHSGDWQG